MLRVITKEMVEHYLKKEKENISKISVDVRESRQVSFIVFK